MTTNNLTELWKKGELEKGYYYVKGIKKYDGINVYWIGYPIHELERRWITEVLAPVPSYEEWEQLQNWADFTNDYHELREKLEISNYKNAEIKELLKECREWVEFMEEKSRADENYKGTMYFKNLLTKIDEVLK